jgi:hypothetical protein
VQPDAIADGDAARGLRRDAPGHSQAAADATDRGQLQRRGDLGRRLRRRGGAGIGRRLRGTRVGGGLRRERLRRRRRVGERPRGGRAGRFVAELVDQPYAQRVAAGVRQLQLAGAGQRRCVIDRVSGR